MSQVMEDIVQGLLKSGTNIFKAKENHAIGEFAPWGGEGNFVLISMAYLNLVIP